MGRRLRRVRHFAQQVVTVTRQLWKVCLCCGTVVRGDPRQDVVPLSALISDTKAARVGTPSRANSATEVSCSCLPIPCHDRSGRRGESVDKIQDKGKGRFGYGNVLPQTNGHASRPCAGHRACPCSAMIGDDQAGTRCFCSPEQSCGAGFVEQTKSVGCFSSLPVNPDPLPNNISSSSARAVRSVDGENDLATPLSAKTSGASVILVRSIDGENDFADSVSWRTVPSQVSQTHSFVEERRFSLHDEDGLSRSRPKCKAHLVRNSDCLGSGTEQAKHDHVSRRLSSQDTSMTGSLANDDIKNVDPEANSETPVQPSTSVQTFRSMSQTSQTDDFIAMRFYRLKAAPNPPLEARKSFSSSSQTDDCVAMRYYSWTAGANSLAQVRPSLGVSSQTDDHVAMMFFSDTELHKRQEDPVSSISKSSQTDDFVAMRFYDKSKLNCSSGQPLRSTSSSSQTDDQVAMRYFANTCAVAPPKEPGPSPSVSSQTDDDVAMRFFSSSIVERATKPRIPTPAIPGPSNENPQTHKHAMSRKEKKLKSLNAVECAHSHKQERLPWMARGNPVPDTKDSSTTIEVARRHWRTNETYPSADDPNSCQVKTQLTLKFPLSKIPCPPLKKPDDLVLEFAVDKVWKHIYPVEWTVQQNISRKWSGRVDLAMLGEYNRQIALKTVEAEYSYQEAQILIECQSYFVVKLCAVLVQREDRFICMTYYPRRDLALWLEKDRERRYFGELQSMWMFGYILAAVQYVHRLGIYHLDVKPANILINKMGYPVLGDFGNAIRRCQLDDFEDLRSFTPAYTCPEIQAGEKPDRLADLWSAGCIFYELIAKKPPCQGSTNSETELKIFLGGPLDIAMFSGKAGEFVSALLNTDKRQRLGYACGTRQVMHHPYLRPVDFRVMKYKCHDGECPVLYGMFRQIERDEFAVRNRPDPIPPESPFHPSKKPPWSKSLRNKENNNNNRWELWSSSSSEESDEEFGPSFKTQMAAIAKEEVELDEEFRMDFKRKMYAIAEEEKESDEMGLSIKRQMAVIAEEEEDTDDEFRVDFKRKMAAIAEEKEKSDDELGFSFKGKMAAIPEEDEDLYLDVKEQKKMPLPKK